MIAGFAGQDRPRRVLGIDASAKIAETRAQVEKIARNTAELIGLDRDLRDDEITVLESWAGEAYGVPVASTLDAMPTPPPRRRSRAARTGWARAHTRGRV